MKTSGQFFTRVICIVVVLVVSAAATGHGGTLIVGEGHVIEEHINYPESTWTSFSIKNDAGEYVTGIKPDEIVATDQILSLKPGQEGTVVAGPAKADFKLYEKSVSGKKLDIVILYNYNGYMSEYLTGIKEQLQKFVDRLQANHVDYRITAIHFDNDHVGYLQFPFYGQLDLDRLKVKIDSFSTGTWGSQLQQAYDAIFLISNLDFRENAEKIALVFTNNLPQTVYAKYHYFNYSPSNPSVGTRSGVELCLKQKGVNLFYCHPYFKYYEIEICQDLAYWCCKPETNSRAWEDESGFKSINKDDPDEKPIRLAWPFSESDLWENLQNRFQLENAPVIDSKYYALFTTSLDPSYPFSDYEYQVNISVPNHGSLLTGSWKFPVDIKRYPVMLKVKDERGLPENITTYFEDYNLYSLMGDRIIKHKYGIRKVEQFTYNNIIPGKYHIDSDWENSATTTMVIRERMAENSWLEVPPGGLTHNITRITDDKHSQIIAARGLLKDIDDWNRRSPGDPFREFAAEANKWLDNLESHNLTYKEQIMLKRFVIALSGYANVIEYAQNEVEASVNSFIAIINDFRQIVRAVKNLHDETQGSWSSWLIESAGAEIPDELKPFIDTISDFAECFVCQNLGAGGATCVESAASPYLPTKKAMLEALEKFIQYAATALIDDLKNRIIEKIPVNIDGHDQIVSLILKSVNGEFGSLACGIVEKEGCTVNREDWKPVVQLAQDIMIKAALQEIWGRLGEGLADIIFANLKLDDSMETQLQPFVKEVFLSFVSETGFNSFDVVLANLRQKTKTLIQNAGVSYYAQEREKIVSAINNIFDRTQVKALSVMNEDSADFILGIARDLTLLAIPTVDAGVVSTEIDTDSVVNVLVRHSFYQFYLKRYFTDEIRKGLYQSLNRAINYKIEHEDEYDTYEHHLLKGDIHNHREILRAFQPAIWTSLEKQKDIKNWAGSMETLQTKLTAISVPLSLLSVCSPSLAEASEKVDKFSSVVLEAAQIVARAIELGLRLQSIDNLGNQAMPLTKAILPDPTTETVPDIGVSSSSIDFPGTQTGVSPEAKPVTIYNSGNSNLSISSITLSDTVNFSMDTFSLPVTLASGESCSVTVRYTPVSAGIHTADLTVGSNDSDTALLKIPLNGRSETYTLTVEKQGLGNGTVATANAGIDCGADCTETYSKGTGITLTAVPASGFVFSGWLADSCSGTGDCQILMNSDARVVALFGLQKADINADKSVNLADAIRALQVTVSMNPVEILYTEADVNSDKKIGMDESVYILQKIAGMR